MTIFPENLINEVRRRLDPESVLRRINYRPEMIQETTTGLKAFCPIHRETIFRTLLVERESGRYRCSNYSCPGNRGGDLIDLYSQATELSYEQAFLELARLHQIEVDLSAVDQYLAHTLEVAQNYFELGELAEAEEHYDSIIRFRENFRPALQGLVRLYEATGRRDMAQTARLRLARLLAAEAEHASALALFQEYLHYSPDDEEAHLAYIDCLNRSGQGEAAAEAYVQLGEMLAGQGEVDRALSVFRQAEALHPVSIDVNEHIIQLLINTGRRDEAVAEHLKAAEHQTELESPPGVFRELEAALRLDPSQAELCVRLAGIVAEQGGILSQTQTGGASSGVTAHWLESEALPLLCGHIVGLIGAKADGPAAQALDLLEQSIHDHPRVLAVRADLEDARGNDEAALDFRLHAVDQYQQCGEHEEALQTLELAMEGRMENVALLSRKANLLRALNRSAEAVPIYLEIVELFRQTDEYESAAAVYQTVIDLEPDRLEHRERQFDLYRQQGLAPLVTQKALELADMYCKQGESGRATGILGRALQTVPDSPDLLLRHAEIFESCGRRAEAAEQFLAVGQLCLARQELDRARQALDSALKCVPEHLEARAALADILAAQGQALQAAGIYTDLTEFYLREQEAESAISLAGKLLALQPDHPPALRLLARAYGLARQPDRQFETLMRLVELALHEQSYARAAELCEEILAKQDDYAPALVQLAEIARLSGQGPQSIKYLWKLSQAQARAGQHEQEQAILAQIVEIDPLHAGSWFRLLELHLLWSTPAALSSVIDQFIERHTAGDRVDGAIQILEDLRLTPNPKAEIYAGLACLYRHKGDTEGLRSALRTQAELLGKLMRDTEALVVWNDLAELQADDMTPLRMRIEIMVRNQMMDEVVGEYRRLARLLTESRRYEEAQVALLEVLNLRPNDLPARDALISILIRTRDHEQAAEQIQEAAGRLLEESQYDEAIRMYERVFEFDQASDETWRRIIAIRQRMEDISGLLEAYGRLLDCLEAKEADIDFEQVAQEAIGLQPDSWAIRQRLAGFYAFHGRERDAEGVLLTLAVRQIENGQIDEAERTLEKIIEFNPESVPARAHRAELLARKGMTEQALNEYMSLTGSLAMATVISPIQAAVETTAGFRSGNYEGIRLIRDYTFDSFIVGSRNNFAHATALAICRAPGKNYNPLFLYSDVGLGKTHLCHAIAHYLIDRHPELKIIYTTTEEFVAELIDAIQANQITAFRNKHKLKDVLIVDDVQFLSGKERAQEEFFNVFNALYQAGKQVILTSDRPPKDITHLEKRLRSRFGAGIIVDIQAPDLETRIAILRHEMTVRGKKDALSDEVVLFVAEQIESNVRDLKGALNQLLARQELSGMEVDIVAARQLIMQHVTNC